MLSVAFVLGAASLVNGFVSQANYTWANVKIGGGGGFVPNIIFNPKQQGLVYARTDIGAAYRMNSDDSWTPLLDWVNDTTWDEWGCDALASDPVDPNIVYTAAGLYTNSYDPNDGHILKSTDTGNTWTSFPLPFKVGGNMPGRGMGERLVIDPNNNSILFFGARSGHGLWRSTDAGATWSNVTDFPSVGTYVQDPSDPTGLDSDIMGIGWVTFDPSSGSSGTGTNRIFVGVANMGATNVFVSEDAGSTWAAVPGQNSTYIPNRGILSPAEGALYLPYANGIGPYDGTDGYVMKYFIENSTWVDITPVYGGGYGYGGLAVDLQKPGTVMVASLNDWYPDAEIYRSLDGGATWTTLWTDSYPPPDYDLYVAKNYEWDVSLAPWIATFTGTDTKFVGWMIEGLVIDPFDSNHFLYGTGLTLMGSKNLLNWDANPQTNITLSSLADGIEETAVQGLIAPPTGPLLVSVVGDVGGFVHTSLTVPPAEFTNPTWAGTVTGVDFAGANASIIVRVSGASVTTASIAISTDGGSTWNPYAGAPSTTANVYGGKVAVSAKGTSIIWTGASGFNGPMISTNGGSFTAIKGLPSYVTLVTADKVNDTVFYAGSGSTFYVSTNGGSSFSVATPALGSTSSINAIAVNPFAAGDVYIGTNAGIFHTTNFGGQYIGLPGATTAYALAVGIPSVAGGTPALFAAATVEGNNALYRTDNIGVSWTKLTNEKYGLSSISGMILAADLRTYGQVYVGTNGRGIFYGHP